MMKVVMMYEEYAEEVELGEFPPSEVESIVELIKKYGAEMQIEQSDEAVVKVVFEKAYYCGLRNLFEIRVVEAE